MIMWLLPMKWFRDSYSWSYLVNIPRERQALIYYYCRACHPTLASMLITASRKKKTTEIKKPMHNIWTPFWAYFRPLFYCFKVASPATCTLCAIRPFDGYYLIHYCHSNTSFVVFPVLITSPQLRWAAGRPSTLLPLPRPATSSTYPPTNFWCGSELPDVLGVPYYVFGFYSIPGTPAVGYSRLQ